MAEVVVRAGVQVGADQVPAGVGVGVGHHQTRARAMYHVALRGHVLVRVLHSVHAVVVSRQTEWKQIHNKQY